MSAHALALSTPFDSAPTPTTEADYLRWESHNTHRHEWVKGRVVAMAGASPNHNRIAGNCFRQIGNFLEGKPCEPFMSDLKIRTASGNYRYPDVVVVCDHDFINNGQDSATPVILIEVLSASTRRVDVQEKLLEYLNIPSLQEYLLIEQEVVSVAVMRRSNGWRSDFYTLGDEIELASIGITLSVEAIYQRVVNGEMQAWLEAQTAAATPPAEPEA